MAGDWIPVRLNLRDHPKVVQLAEITGLDTFSVIGRLVVLWAWASDHSEDGFLSRRCHTCVTACHVEQSFFDALSTVGWCDIDADGVRIPQWDEWLSDSAKKRASNRRRQQLCRDKKAENKAQKHVTKKRDRCHTNVTLQKRTEQKRTEGEREEAPTAPLNGIEAVGEFFHTELCCNPQVAVEAIRRLGTTEADLPGWREALVAAKAQGLRDPRSFVRSRALRFRTAAEADILPAPGVPPPPEDTRPLDEQLAEWNRAHGLYQGKDETS